VNQAQIRKRFSLSSKSVLAQLCALDPDEALSNNRKVKSIIPLAVQFPNLVNEVDLDSLQDQWQQLPSAKKCIEHSNRGLEVSAVPAFWKRLHLIKDGMNNSKFGLLSEFMCNMMVSPFHPTWLFLTTIFDP